MRVNITGTANFNQVRGQLTKLKADIEQVNQAMAKAALIPEGGTVEGFAAQQRALRGANAAYAQALASSGAYTVQQIKLSDAIDRQVDLLQKQKLAFRDVFGRGAQDRMRQVYRQQLAMQKGAEIMSTSGQVTDGKNLATLAIPNQIPETWNTLGKQIGFVGHQLSSASHQLQNWGKNTQWAGRQMMVGIGVPLAALAASTGYLAYQTDKELTRIQKVYDTTADANSTRVSDQMAVEKELAELRVDSMNTAIKAAKEYGSTITDTLQVQAELAATGLTGNRLQTGTSQVMKIARLGEIDQEVATKSLIAMQQVLRASTKETADMFNYLNAVENATSLSTADFAAAIPRALGPMKQMSAEGSSAGDVMKNLSVLMVAMRERGIEAGEGANAIKAMMQRLYRPSQKVREEWQAMLNIDPQDLVDRAGGDIMKILPMISDAVADLSKPERIKALAGLFGTYQVQRMSAMLEGIENINDASSQTNAVLKLNQQSVKDYASIAEREMKRYRESVAGQFDIALKTLQGEMAKMGEPFVIFATYALRALGKVAEGFNSMPGWAKQATLLGAVLLALGTAGVMLIGVFANLLGTGGKMIATVLKSVGSFELMTKAQFNAQVAAKLADKQFEKEASTTAILTRQIEALNRSLWQYSAAMNQARVASQAQLGAAGVAASARPTSSAAAAPAPPPKAILGAYDSSPVAGAPIIGAGGVVNQERLNDLLTEDEEKRKRISKYAVGAAASTGAMVASMALMATSSNATADNIAQWLMIASIAAPAAVVMKDAFKAIDFKAYAATAKQWTSNQVQAAKAAATTAYEAKLAAAATGAHAAGATRTTKALAAGSAATAKMASGARAAGAAIAGMMGPVGWIATALAGVGLGLYKLYQHDKKITAEKVAQAKAITDQKNLLSDLLEIEPKSYDKINSVLPANRLYGMTAERFSELETAMMDKNKPLVDAYKSGSQADRDYIVATKYAQVLNSVGGNATKARTYIEALFRAAGDGAVDARTKALQYYNQLGQSIDKADFRKIFGDGITSALSADRDKFKTQATEIGKVMGDAIANGGSGAATDMSYAFQNEMNKSWSSIMGNLDSITRSTLEKLGVSTGSQFGDLMQQYISEGEDPSFLAEKFNLSTEDSMRLSMALTDAYSESADEVERMKGVESAIVAELAKQLGIKQKITTMDQLRQQPEFQILNATARTAEGLYKQLDAKGKIHKEDRLTVAQQIAQISGLRVMDSLESQLIILAQGHGNAWERANASADQTASAAGEVAAKLRGMPKSLDIALNFTGAELRQIQKAGMEGLTGDLADAASNSFDARMQASLDATSRAWDNRIEAAQAAGERASERLDSRWERINNNFERRYERRQNAVEKFYDRRIDAVQNAIKAEEKAEEIRQRIFDAEERRISRSADMQNRTIDFNMAVRTGDLDEAAKIRNDMEAQAGSWLLEDARRNSSTASQRRTERLGNRQDNLEEQRDRALKALQRRERDERASLARREKAEKASLERRTRANEKALQAQADDAKAAAQARWNNEKTSFNQRLDLFKSYIARDQKDLKRWMKAVGISYDDFGGSVKKKGESWSQFFERSMVKHMRVAGNEMASDKMWSGLGQKNALKIAQGMGFPSMNAYKKFITTGKLPDTFGKNIYKPGSGNSGGGNDPTKSRAGNAMTAQHGGGIIGAEKSNRRGVARTLKGLHPSEQLINARKGEYLIPKERVSGNEGVLDAIRNGSFKEKGDRRPPKANTSAKNVGRGIGGAGNPLSGLVGMTMGIMGNAMAQGMAAGIQAQMSKQVEEANMTYTTGRAGVYGSRAFGSEQLRNAATIASVGKSMGMSARDIMIGIMTAITESGLINVKYGDRDSQGLFQQRPSQGWGTIAQVTDPQYSSRKFFQALKGLSGRNDMSPWAAAQAVQRSAFSDGSNYQIYWDEANAIYKNGGIRAMSATMGLPGGGANYRPGIGGLHRASVPGKGWSTTHDYRNGLKSPLYAIDDGRIIESRALPPSYGSGQHPNAYPRGYGSYGVTVVLKRKNGDTVRYAHMWPGTNIGLGPVKGGTLVGLSASTGNSTGPHTHFEYNGSYNAQSAFERLGIGLKTGGYTTKDGMANLHKSEVVISPSKTKELYSGIGNLERVMNAAANNIGNGVGGDRTTFGGEYGNLNPGIFNQLAALQGSTQNNLSTAKPNTGNNTGGSNNSGGNTGGNPPIKDIPSTAQKGVFRTGTYNMAFPRGNGGNIQDLKSLTKMADVLSLQEVTPEKAKMKPWLAQMGWNWFQKHRGTALIWNTANLLASRLGVKRIGGSVHPYATYGKFTNKKGGGSAWQISTHLEPYGRGGPTRQKQFKALNSLIKNLRGNSNTPVVLSGDFNTSNVGHMGMGPATQNPTVNGKGGRLDHILSKGMTKTAQSIFDTVGSDHKAVLASFNLPGLSTGGYTMSDGMAMLHKNELVLSPEKTRELYKGIQNVANNEENRYNTYSITINGYQHDADDLANKVISKINAKEARRPGARTR